MLLVSDCLFVGALGSGALHVIAGRVVMTNATFEHNVATVSRLAALLHAVKRLAAVVYATALVGS